MDSNKQEETLIKKCVTAISLAGVMIQFGFDLPFHDEIYEGDKQISTKKKWTIEEFKQIADELDSKQTHLSIEMKGAIITTLQEIISWLEKRSPKTIGWSEKQIGKRWVALSTKLSLWLQQDL